jgi:hypothetical protein
MDAKESAEHAAAAAAQYKEAQTPTQSKEATPKRDRTASLDDVDDAKPIANYRARGVCKAALGKSFLFGRRWTPGTYAVDIDRSHVVRFEDDAAGTCWEDTPTNRYAFAGDCDVKESGDTWDAVLELSRVADLLAKDAKPQSLALKFPTSTRRDQFRRAIDEARRRDPAAEALEFARSQVKTPLEKPTRKAPTPFKEDVPSRSPSRTPEPKKILSPRSKLRELRATLDDDIGPAVAVLAAGLADDPDDTWRATARASVAQLNGRLDRLQFAGVDGVVTADIEDEEERSFCRDARKALNRDVERVRERIQGLHVELNKVS